MDNLTLYEIMGEDMDLTTSKLSNSQIAIEVRDENNGIVFYEETHPVAWDSLVTFARQILWCHDKMEIADELEEIN